MLAVAVVMGVVGVMVGVMGWCYVDLVWEGVRLWGWVGSFSGWPAYPVRLSDVLRCTKSLCVHSAAISTVFAVLAVSSTPLTQISNKNPSDLKQTTNSPSDLPRISNNPPPPSPPLPPRTHTHTLDSLNTPTPSLGHPRPRTPTETPSSPTPVKLAR